MRSRDVALTVCLAVAIVGCAATRRPQPSSPAERAEVEQLPKISLCFETVIPTSGNAGSSEAEAGTVSVDFRDANLQLETFRGTGLFSRVSFAHAPDSGCDLFLNTYTSFPLGELLMVPTLLPALVTFSVIPGVLYHNQRSRFAVADTPDELLQFDCRTYTVVWFPLAGIFGALPGWEMSIAEQPRESQPLDCSGRLAVFLFEHRERIWPPVGSAP